MIQITGLIIDVYALARLAQVPIELAGRQDEIFKLKFMYRLLAVAGDLFGYAIVESAILSDESERNTSGGFRFAYVVKHV